MKTSRDRLVRDAAARGKYAPPYRHLLSTHPPELEWRTTFGEVEAILGFRLPDSARPHRPWWSNSKKGNGHSHALAWQAAGWRTRTVDVEAETLQRLPLTTSAAQMVEPELFARAQTR